MPSLTDQLAALSKVAIQQGYYDADDLIKRLIGEETDELRFFCLSFRYWLLASNALKAMESLLGGPKIEWTLVTDHTFALVSFSSLSGQRLFRAILIHMNAKFAEGGEHEMQKQYHDAPR